MSTILKGDFVLIKSHKRTDQTYGVNSQMLKNVGTVQKVNEISVEAVLAGGGYWRLEDVQKVSRNMADNPLPKPVMFNEKDLYL
jgi:hypothetical protein